MHHTTAQRRNRKWCGEERNNLPPWDRSSMYKMGVLNYLSFAMVAPLHYFHTPRAVLSLSPQFYQQRYSTLLHIPTVFSLSSSRVHHFQCFSIITLLHKKLVLILHLSFICRAPAPAPAPFYIVPSPPSRHFFPPTQLSFISCLSFWHSLLAHVSLVARTCIV